MYPVKINKNLCLLTGALALGLLIMQCRAKDELVIVTIPVKIEDAFLNLLGQPVALIQRHLDSVLNLDRRFTELFSEYILGNQDSLDEKIVFEAYFADTSRSRLRDSCSRIFKMLDWDQEVGIPLSNYHHQFPERNIPKIYLLITDFNYGIFIFQDDQGKDAIGIGEEMFTGNTDLYNQLALNNPNFSAYLNRTFNVDHLPSKIIQALLNDLLPAPTSNRLLDHIVSEGKKLYFAKRLIPGIPDTILHEYTPAQWRWVTENEREIWRFLLTDKLLYQSRGKDIINLVQASPHSQGMPPEAPGRAVNYIGLKIMESLVRNENLNLQEILNIQNAEDILRRSRYKPR